MPALAARVSARLAAWRPFVSAVRGVRTSYNVFDAGDAPDRQASSCEGFELIGQSGEVVHERISAADLAERGFPRLAEAASRADVATLSREQLIDRVSTLNPTAPAGYLAGFETDALLAYLERLLRQGEPRSPRSGWVRTPLSPAITCSIA
jgi:hypothetical protein